ncbi:hypothetical protein M9H77_07798 [Catharanthus roseus]|uniref:Uncharacterized protein n=1 Tax=Catharanthus roseus TaxID=4058 RepID=A0ACC0BW90_CATRO|nr:hypothetical protein M9H77_07798 [Catharanthus roseus]
MFFENDDFDVYLALLDLMRRDLLYESFSESPAIFSGEITTRIYGENRNDSEDQMLLHSFLNEATITVVKMEPKITSIDFPKISISKKCWWGRRPMKVKLPLRKL